MGDIRDKTTKWLWSIAPSHMKGGNKPDEERDSYKLFSVWAKNTEKFKEKAYEVRKNCFPQYANPDTLRLLGKERGIEPLRGEDLENFRKRIVNALDWWQLAGTVKGLKTIFTILGFEDVEIKEVLKEDRSRWAEFEVILQKQKLTEEDVYKVFTAKELINELKPAHEKLAGLIIGISNILSQSLYLHFAIKHGRHITVGLRIDPKTKPLSIFTAMAIRKARKTIVGVHIPKPKVEPYQIFTGFFIRRARKITIGVANHG